MEAGVANQTRLRFEYQDDVEWIRIIDQFPEAHRILHFETSIQGVLNLKDPSIPVLEYIQVMLKGAQRFSATPEKVLIGGLGSCALLHAVHAWLAGSSKRGQVAVVESNQRMVDLARRFFRLEPATPVVVDDFRQVLDDTAWDGQDIIFVDCYSATAIPPHLTTVEFITSVRQRLAVEGLAVFNFWSPMSDDNVGDYIRGILEVFGQAAVVACVEDRNLIVFAKCKPLDWPQRLQAGKWDYHVKALDLRDPANWTYYMKHCEPIFDGGFGDRVQSLCIDF